MQIKSKYGISIIAPSLCHRRLKPPGVRTWHPPLEYISSIFNYALGRFPVKRIHFVNAFSFCAQRDTFFFSEKKWNFIYIKLFILASLFMHYDKSTTRY